MKQKFFSFCTIILVLCTQFCTAFGAPNIENTATQEPTLTADAAILMDAQSGAILYEKDAHTTYYPASITKLMTLLLAFEEGNLEDELTFSRNAVYSIEPGSSHIAIQEDEVITLEQALYGIMLQSANECSNGVAEYVDGTVEAFTQHMTERAKELGCEHTNFVNPHGLHDENHYTTAYDMALIAQQLLKNETYRSMMGTTYYEIPPTNKQEETRYLHGQHQMLNKNSLYYYEFAEGGKTGFTSQALNTLVTYAKKGDMELIAVVLHCNGAQHYVDTTALFEYGFSNFQTVKAFSAGALPQNISVTETYKQKTTEKAKTTISLSEDVYVTMPKDAQISDITTNIDCPESVPVPVSAGDSLGQVAVMFDGETLCNIDLTAQTSVNATTPEERAEQAQQLRNHILKIIFMILAVCVIALAVVICVVRIRRQRERERRRRARKQARRASWATYEPYQARNNKYFPPKQ